MTCQHCGAAIPADAVFCKACGTRPASALSETRLWTPSEAAVRATKIYTEEALARTAIYPPQATLGEGKPLLGWLVVVDGSDLWKVFTLPDEEGQFILGRGKECAFRCEDPQLEERHASIRVKEGKIHITDLDTVTGTLVNDKETARCDLHDGDVIKAGTTTLKLRTL
jgi:hypothetical protein